jgi:DNA-binding winged helix-turn-helix (wHTH) protein
MRVNSFSSLAIEFGRFRLIWRSRDLLADGAPVAIGNRALDILIVLIEARGALVAKDEIMSRVWPGAIVEENTLQFQISTLRKALGKDRDFIRTVSGRGYRFVAEIQTDAGETEVSLSPIDPPAAQPRESLPQTNLPASRSDLIGREAQLADLANLVAAHRLITLVGTGGIGKTRLGLKLGRRLLPQFSDGVWITDLELLSDPELVLPAIAGLFGIARGPCLLERLTNELASKHLLLLLDHCEHVAGAVAQVTDGLRRASTSLRLIATSREPLHIEGESIYHVPGLAMPGADVANVPELLRSSAVRLFMVRLHATDSFSPPDARVAAAMAKICRRLGGIPLAIELAAARAMALGIEGFASRLDDPHHAGDRRMPNGSDTTMRSRPRR